MRKYSLLYWIDFNKIKRKIWKTISSDFKNTTNNYTYIMYNINIIYGCIPKMERTGTGT